MWQITRDAIEDLSGVVGLHAGAVAVANGSAILLPAFSGSGKTTLTTGLVAAGWSYLTDELSVLDGATLSVEPFGRPPCLSPGSLSLFPGLEARLPQDLRSQRHLKWQVPLEHIPGTMRREPAHVRAIVFPHFEQGAKTVLRPLRRVDALVRLLPNAFNLAAEGSSGLQTLARLCRQAPAYDLTMGDLQEAIRAVEQVGADVGAGTIHA